MGQKSTKPGTTTLIDLPATAHRKILAYLKPWELFKVSRVSRKMQQLIAHFGKHRVTSFSLFLEEKVLMIRAEFPGKLVFQWTFFDVQDKPYFEKTFTNRCYYQQHYEITSYHENVDSAFLFALRNILKISDCDGCPLEYLQVHFSRIKLFHTLPHSYIAHRKCENLCIKNKKANDENDRDFSINFTLTVLHKIGRFENMKLKFASSSYRAFHCEKVYYNPEPSRLMPEDCSFENNFDDFALNKLLKNWLIYEEKMLKQFQIKAERLLNFSDIFEGIETIPWDRRNNREVVHYSGATPENTVMIFRIHDSEDFATVTIVNKRGIGYSEISFLSFAKKL